MLEGKYSGGWNIKIEVHSALSWEVASGHENGSTVASYVKADVRIHLFVQLDVNVSRV